MTGDALPADAAFAPLRRLVGGLTAACISIGVAIGSGIFRSPGEIVQQVGSVPLVLAIWIAGGGFTLAAGLVCAELATRLPRAGGDYAFLRAAYGDFVAFFFGWSYTVFIIGAGAATIAVALGEAACVLFSLPASRGPWIGVGAVTLTVGMNCLGLLTGAATQNLLTLLKSGVLLAVALAAIGWAWRHGPASAGADDFSALSAARRGGSGWGIAVALGLALQNALWAYDGVTDSVKLAEEIRDVRRTLPAALIGATALVTVIYVVVNLAFFAVLPPRQIAASQFVANDVMRLVLGDRAQRLTALLTVLLCVGSLASTTLATVRVTFALGRDGLGPRRFGRMSRGQSPVAALLLIGAITSVFAVRGGFERVLGIYTFAAAILYSLVYVSLLILRRRNVSESGGHFHCPAGRWLVAGLVATQAGLAVHAAWRQPGDMKNTLLIFAIIAALCPRPRYFHLSVPR